MMARTGSNATCARAGCINYAPIFKLIGMTPTSPILATSASSARRWRAGTQSVPSGEAVPLGPNPKWAKRFKPALSSILASNGH